MPHFFIKIPPSSSNPGPWTRARLEEVVSKHKGTLEHFWHDDPKSPGSAYILVQNGDSKALATELHAHETLTLHHPASTTSQ
jgi:hypothetical protein